jgi:hypothetical protein
MKNQKKHQKNYQKKGNKIIEVMKVKKHFHQKEENIKN